MFTRTITANHGQNRCTPLLLRILVAISSLASAGGMAGPLRLIDEGSAKPPKCVASGTDEIKIACNYDATLRSQEKRAPAQRIVLDHAALSFELRHESHMQIDLTFTNQGKGAVSPAHDVYLAIDDDKGKNHLRRLLPHVSLQRLEPGKPTTFSETILAPAFSPGPYTVYLWIPVADPSKRFDSSENLLLESIGVAEPATGLNAIAGFESRR